MKKEYDLTKFKAELNPYAKRLKRQVTMRVAISAIEYFQKMSKEVGIPYQNLINSYLLDCAENQRKMQVKWG